MMKEIVEQNKMYLKICSLKSDIKSEEVQKRELETLFQKLQSETLEIGFRLKNVSWQIKRAEIVFFCEKERQKLFQANMEEAQNAIAQQDFISVTYSSTDEKILLEKQKTDLMSKLQKLKTPIQT